MNPLSCGVKTLIVASNKGEREDVSLRGNKKGGKDEMVQTAKINPKINHKIKNNCTNTLSLLVIHICAYTGGQNKNMTGK